MSQPVLKILIMHTAMTQHPENHALHWGLGLVVNTMNTMIA